MSHKKELIFKNSKFHTGVMDLSTSERGIPFRIFYPAEEDTSNESFVGWFVRDMTYFIEGYMHFLLPKWRDSTLGKYLISIIAMVSSLFMPMARTCLPKCVMGGKPYREDGGKYPLILYSHGLTGTGEENALMFAYWASQGYVVAAIHHCDGSSNRVHPKGLAEVLYHHPDYSNYDPNFRVVQISRREEELFELREYILKHSDFPTTIAEIIDNSQIFVAGFSYGAATASLSTVRRPDAYKACILLDGWFHIEITTDTVKPFDFPPSVHLSGLSIPALFIGSEQFASRPGLADATNNLAISNTSDSGSVTHVLAGSKHQNFTDVGYWLPGWLLQKIGATGKSDYYKTHHQILTLTHDFLKKHTAK